MKHLPAPEIMGIINLSPQSFYGVASSLDQALRQAEAMHAAGAHIIDLGAEATNPKANLAESLTPEAECDQIIPVVEAVASRLPVVISVDTRHALVMQAAIDAGARLINDQSALTEAGAMDVLSRSPHVRVILMHQTRLHNPGMGQLTAEDVVPAVVSALGDRLAQCEAAGVDKARCLIDPGFGRGHFGKSTEANYQLLAHLSALKSLDCPLVVGVSRKSFLGDGADAQSRLPASLAAALLAIQNGAAILRVHDVAQTAQVCSFWHQLVAAQTEAV